MATGYGHSRGALEELGVARQLGLRILYQDHSPLGPQQFSWSGSRLGVQRKMLDKKTGNAYS